MVNTHPTTIIMPSKTLPSRPSSTFQTALHITLKSTLTALRNAVSETDSNRHDKRKAKHRRTPFVVIADGHASLDLVDTPEVDSHRVEQRQARNEGECPGRCQRDRVTKVEQGGGDGSKDDREFELEEKLVDVSYHFRKIQTYP